MAADYRRQVWLATLMFLALTGLMTYPLPFSPDDQIRDYGDSLLNTWILATVGHKLYHLDFNHFFAANIFYPESKPLLYSETLIPQAIVAWPLFALTGNPVLAHNIVLLMAIFTSALGMFFLTLYLTRKFWPSTIAGTVYAFPPFMMAHTVQLQVVSAGGLPLIFLFLHRYFDRRRLADWLGFSLTYIVQSLANIYYALFLVIFAGLFILTGSLQKKTYQDKKFWVHLISFLLFAVLCLGPLFWSYARQQQKEGFERSVGAQAKITSYLATGRINRLYGRWSARFRQPEGELFPGLAAALLVLAGVSLCCWKKRPTFSLGLNAGESSLNPFPTLNHSLGQCPPEGPGGAASAACFSRQVIAFYLMIMLLAVSLSFGTKGPFWLLHRYVPGYKAIRAVPRFHIFTMLALAVLAAYGLSFVLAKIRSGVRRKFLSLACLGAILLEYASVPLPTRPILPRERIPAVYQELAQWPEKKVILELPLPEPGTGIGRVECLRMYYSLFHGHRLVNGYSGFFAPEYVAIREKLKLQPLEENILSWRQAGIDLIIIHGDELGREGWADLIATLKASPHLHLRGQFAHDFLFSLL